ncbi:MAG: DUF3300 domain-containing protein [Proteobacteria bacterium]|nr:DUF3300 domain-containing protein [Pseudomonadota bacterium]
MFKSLHNKQFFPLAVLSAALYSMTLAAALVGDQPGDNGEPNHGVFGTSGDEAMTGVGPGQVKPFSTEELEDLVAPVALYPDELLAIVLPATAYPLQIVLAARFLEQLEKDDSLQPDEAWDESVVALLNYPEVIDLLNNDLEWTWQLGEAVLNQETEVIEAVEAFRDRAVLAGNLKTDEHQIVNNQDGTIEITPADPEVIYVPYYEPERVVVYQPYPVYYYYPEPYPVYYYPYPVGHHFSSGFFWGITTAYTIGWHSHHLNVHRWDYYSHPYYGHNYFHSNHYYHGWSHHDSGHRQARNGQHHGGHDGDRWQPGGRHGARPGYRGPNNDHLGDNNVVAASVGSRFQQANTFKPRPGFQGNIIGATNTRSGDAVGRTGDRYSAMARDATRTTQRDISQSSGKVRRNRLDWAKDRPNISLEPVAQNKSSANRVNPIAKSQGRINQRTVPSNQGRYVSRSDRSHVVRTSRPDPVASNRSSVRVVNTLAYSSVKVANARPSPLPRQSQRPVSRSTANRPAPAASKPSPPPRSERGRSTSKGSRGQGHARRP